MCKYCSCFAPEIASELPLFIQAWVPNLNLGVYQHASSYSSSLRQSWLSKRVHNCWPHLVSVGPSADWEAGGRFDKGGSQHFINPLPGLPPHLENLLWPSLWPLGLETFCPSFTVDRFLLLLDSPGPSGNSSCFTRAKLSKLDMPRRLIREAARFALMKGPLWKLFVGQSLE